MNRKPRVWIVTELYYPEDGATGHLLTQIAEGLTDDAEVHVLCAQPSYTQKREKAPVTETHHDVQIRRCRSTAFSKDRMLLRLINVFTVLASFSWNMFWRFRRGDTVMVVTNPPPLPLAALAACWCKRARSVLLIHDVYPDVLVPTGFTSHNSLSYRLVDWFSKRLLAGVHQIITIGRDMQRRVIAKNGQLAAKTTVIPNWCDDETIRPVARNENPLRKQLDLDDRFVVQYSGNIGRTHGLETIAEAAKILQDQGHTEILWLICGDGGSRQSFEERCRQLQLQNIRFEDFFARNQLANSLSCGDVGIISFIPGMSGISVPSRMYNFFAAGRPVIGVTENDSELAMTLTEFDVGWVVAPDDPAQLAKCVLEIYRDRDQQSDWIQHCREIACKHFTREIAMDKYRAILLNQATDAGSDFTQRPMAGSAAEDEATTIR